MPRKTPLPKTSPKSPGPKVRIIVPNGAKPREAPPPVNPGSRKPPGTPPKPSKNP